MTIQLSQLVRNNRLDQIETTTGVSPNLLLFSGAVPANCGAADPPGVLATIPLPSDWMGPAGGGTKLIAGTWTGFAAAAGTAISFRVKSGGGACHIQGTAGTTGGGADLILDNNVLAVGQTINVTVFTLTDGNQ